jgi:hypothetical protein
MVSTRLSQWLSGHGQVDLWLNHPTRSHSVSPLPFAYPHLALCSLALTYSVHVPLKHGLVSSAHAGDNKWIKAVAMITPEPKNFANLSEFVSAKETLGGASSTTSPT